MDNKHKKRMGGAFFYETDGVPCDSKLHEEMLRDEVRIRQELISAGIIREIVLESKKPNKTTLDIMDRKDNDD